MLIYIFLLYYLVYYMLSSLIFKTTPLQNTLYYGDNLDILRRYIPDESIYLIYIDPLLKEAKRFIDNKGEQLKI